MSLTTFDGYRPTEQVDEMAVATDMMGPESMRNQANGKLGWWYDPTKSLIAMWVVAIILYWLLAYFFRGVRS